MTWHIADQVIRGELDCRTKGRVIGHLWLVGRSEPLVLDLTGSPHRDLAGHVLHFTNPQPVPGDLSGLVTHQSGVAGEITAARRAKVPNCDAEELMSLYADGKPLPWQWRNGLHLEWHDRRNGRVMIESVGYQLMIDPSAAWTMTRAEAAGLAAARAIAITQQLTELGETGAPNPPAAARASAVDDQEDDDAAQSAAEAAADAETARMDLLLDRIGIRLEREGYQDGKFEVIITEETARLRRERGEPEQAGDLPPGQEWEAEGETRIDFLNPVMIDQSSSGFEDWSDPDDEESHPLLNRCSNAAIRLHEEAAQGGWLPDDSSPEHPITALVAGVMNASDKLAGVFGMHCDEDESWPPPAAMAGPSLVRLKKTRACLRDSLRALTAADQERLGSPVWRVAVRAELSAIQGEVGALIAEVRAILADGSE